jgi:hypothetical protein
MRLQSHNLRPPDCFFLRLQAQILFFRRRFSHKQELTVLVYRKVSTNRVRWHGWWRRKEKVPDAITVGCWSKGIPVAGIAPRSATGATGTIVADGKIAMRGA